MKNYPKRSLVALLFLTAGLFINGAPAHADQCTVSGTGAGQTLSAPTDGNSCTFEFSTSNVADLSGAVDITVTLANGLGSNDFTIGLGATIIDPNGPNDNIALTGIEGFDNFGYNNAATASLTGWTLGGPRCGSSGSYQLDGFGNLTECFSGPTNPAPVFLLSNDDPGNFTANDQGVLFAVRLALTPSSCTAFFSNRSTSGDSTIRPGDCGYTGYSNVDPPSVPEPSAMILVGAGLIGISVCGRRYILRK